MSRVVDFLIAEKQVVFVVVLNTIAMTLLGFCDEHDRIAAELLAAVDYGCVVYFLMETALKLHRFGFAAYWAQAWNRFDFVVVLTSLPALAAPLVDVGAFGIVLVLRLGRLFRLFRLLRFIPNRDSILSGVRRALRASIGVVLALLLVNVVLALGANVLFGRLAPEHFGDPAIAFYSLFKVFTVEGWYELPELLAQRSDNAMMGLLARVYFMGAVAVGGILGLSLANAIFVDEMTIDNTAAVENSVEELRGELRALREDIAKLTSLRDGRGP